MIVLILRKRNIGGSSICVQIRYFRSSCVATTQLERVSCTRCCTLQKSSRGVRRKTFDEKSKGTNPATVTISWNLIWLTFKLILNNNKNVKNHETLLGQYYTNVRMRNIQCKAKKLCEKVWNFIIALAIVITSITWKIKAAIKICNFRCNFKSRVHLSPLILNLGGNSSEYSCLCHQICRIDKFEFWKILSPRKFRNLMWSIFSCEN